MNKKDKIAYSLLKESIKRHDENKCECDLTEGGSGLCYACQWLEGIIDSSQVIKDLRRENKMDYKDMIQMRADEIAYEKYKKDFYNLSSELQNEVYRESMEWYKDYLADQIDLQKERLKNG